jgi:hypothetical protein
MQIVISNREFPYDIGCRLLKLKYKECPFADLEEIWDEIKPMNFKEIARMENLEERRVGILCLGIERLAKEVKPKLIDKQTIKKVTNYLDKEGNVVNKKYNDTYELYEVDGKNLSQGIKQNWRIMQNSYFVKFKDTSTDREYMIWVEPRSVFETNRTEKSTSYYRDASQINAIQCIAWSIQTTVEKGNIKEILRQGDCILVKPKNMSKGIMETPRHLTEKEYRELLVAES